MFFKAFDTYFQITFWKHSIDLHPPMYKNANF